MYFSILLPVTCHCDQPTNNNNNIEPGFIIVAACVMTFEARDSASKVVPARFKLNYGKHDNSARSSNADRRPTGKRIPFVAFSDTMRSGKAYQLLAGTVKGVENK